MLKRKYKVIILLLIALFILSACDNTEESIIKDQKYLSLALNNDYSVKTLTPGQGRYSYDKNSVAEIKFELNEGYNFDGWGGEASSRLASTDKENTYQLKMSEDSNLKLKTILSQFKLLNVGLADIREEDYSEGIEISDFPYNLEELRLTFNNKVNEDNDIHFEITDPDGANPSEAIFSSEDFSNEIFNIEENQVIVNWNNFNPAETEDLSFGSDYQLILSEDGLDNSNYIFDPKLNDLNSEVKINFTIEEAKPEKVENLVLSTKDDKLELSWLRSEENKDYQNESYVSKYIIYEFKNESDFSKENNDNVIEFNVNQDKKIKRTTIYNEDEFKNLDLENNTYHYRVTAVNDVENESELSDVVSTD